jgi:hypothetical protein
MTEARISELPESGHQARCPPPTKLAPAQIEIKGNAACIFTNSQSNRVTICLAMLPNRHFFAEADKKLEPKKRWFLRGLVLVSVLLTLAFGLVISPGGFLAPNFSAESLKSVLRPGFAH